MHSVLAFSCKIKASHPQTLPRAVEQIRRDANGVSGSLIWAVADDRWKKSDIEQLLQLISDNPTYRGALFGTGLYRPRSMSKWRTHRDICFVLFQTDEGWINDMIEKGLVVKRDGKSMPTDKWNSNTSNPVKGILTR